MKKPISLTLADTEAVSKVCYALSSPIRVEILDHLSKHTMIISDIASYFDLPLSSAALHIKKLENAGLIKVQVIPGSKGSQKICGINTNHLDIEIIAEGIMANPGLIHQISIPIGNYFDYKVKPSCGIASESKDSLDDDTTAFCSPDRFNAQIIWLSQGYLEYRVPSEMLKKAPFTRIEFSFELCSECLGYNNEWKSDITFSVNHKEIGIIESLADYGGRPGRLNPIWWSPQSTQYGTLQKVVLTDKGCYINDRHIPDISTGDLELTNKDSDFFTFRLEVKPDARYAGGFNLFGEKFGDHPQNILVQVYNDSII